MYSVRTIDRFTSFFSKEYSEKLVSKNTAWNTANLIKRFAEPQYHSEAARVKLLSRDGAHFAQEFLLVRPVTQFSYEIKRSDIKSLMAQESGYTEAMTTYTAKFAQDLAANGLNANRATIEHQTLQNIQQYFAALTPEELTASPAVLLTSFPDDVSLGYHGSDTKKHPHDPKKKERHHSFYYLLTAKPTDADTISITTTQYRVWHNAHQALGFHKLLEKPIDELDCPVPNALFANTIPLDATQLQSILEKTTTGELPPPEHFPDPATEQEIERLFRTLLYADAHAHSHNHTQRPTISEADFWETYITDDNEEHIVPLLFGSFYLPIVLPLFSQAVTTYTQLLEAEQLRDHSTQKKLYKTLQKQINTLDTAFFYYHKTALGTIKALNQSEIYAEYLKKNQKTQVREWLQNKLLSAKNKNAVSVHPSGEQLQKAFNAEQRLRAGEDLTTDEKNILISTWGFFSFAGGAASLLQCGALAPFTLPLSALKNTGAPTYMGSNVLGGLRMGSTQPDAFVRSLEKISVFDKQLLLQDLTKEPYVELDLRAQGATHIWSVPQSYLEKNGCVVGENGEVLGPCIDPQTKQRISLNDPRDTFAFPMPLQAFAEKIRLLEQSILTDSNTDIALHIDDAVQLSEDQKKQARALLKKLYHLLFRQTLGLDALFNGVIVSTANTTPAILQSLALQLNFARNPLATLRETVYAFIQNRPSYLNQEMYTALNMQPLESNT